MTNERPLRIGTAERTAAMKALDEHLAAGRLGIEEYGERSALAANATTAPELAALFDDLPAPHPTLPGIADSDAASPLPAVTPDPTPPAARNPDALQVWAPRLMALAPIVALALFLLTRNFVFFLLIPAAGAMLGARNGRHS
jgi:hypothetical protein